MHQWYAHLKGVSDAEVGLLGGGLASHSDFVATTTVVLFMQHWATNMLFNFDECHHLPTDFNRVIAEYAIAPYRLDSRQRPNAQQMRTLT